MKNLLIALFFLNLSSYSQTILNAYAKITSVNGSQTILTLSIVNEVNHTFAVGGKVIVMQMQDDVIGANTGNNSSFGNLSSIANAGKYEIRTITSRLPVTGTPTSITLSSALSIPFNTGTNSSVQLITFRDMGTNFTTTTNITGLAWDGNIGGVIAFEVANSLTLNHSISADGIGFLGGAKSSNANETCNSGFFSGNDANKGYKGEGIYKSTNTAFLNGRGKLLSGGGGGSQNNSGGAGGGNYSAGGDGGLGWGCTGASSGRGKGGISLSAIISGTQIFMGGGGGGGQQNNSGSTNGGNGGGIILIKATTLVTNTVCTSAIKITANGQNASNSGNDGGGGAGGGGSIILQINNFSASSACPLVVNANGGNGGCVNDPGAHGGGGGGGQGVIMFPASQPIVNIISSTSNGVPGTDNTGGTVTGTPGGGPNNGGVFVFTPTPLPIELINFDGTLANGIIELNWSTASEINNDYFTVEKSLDGINFLIIGNVKAANLTNNISKYQLNDNTPNKGTNYYRLKQTDFDGTFEYSKIINVEFYDTIDFSVYPNPLNSNNSLFIALNKKYTSKVELNIYDVNGKNVFNRAIDVIDQTDIRLDNLNLSSGIYSVQLSNEYINSTKRLIIGE